MNLTLLEDITLNIILVVFPILVYLVLVCYKDDISKEYNGLLLNISLFTSLYLCLKFGIKENNTQILLFCNIPIVIAYLKNKPLSGVILSLINILYYYFVFNNLYIISIITIKCIAYFILYLCAKKRKLSSESFILSIAVLQGFFLSFEYFFRDIRVSPKDLIEVILVVFIYYFVTFFILYTFKTIEKVNKLNSSVKLLEKDKKIKDALFKLTHEIKNPLAVCKGYLEMIDLEKKDKASKYICIMRQEIERSLNIMSDFVEINKIKINKTEIDLNMLLEDVDDSFKMIIKTKGINFIYKERDDEEIYFKGDYERLKQVLINILKNSFEAIEKKGKIEMTTNIYKKYFDITIEDDGIGMDEDTLYRIKEMFYTTKPNGTGLGISLSNEIVRAHGGELIYSSKLGIGTKVTIRLPFE